MSNSHESIRDLVALKPAIVTAGQPEAAWRELLALDAGGRGLSPC